MENYSMLSKKLPGSDLLSRGILPSTIGAGGLNCRVRDGNGCFPSAITARNLFALFPQNCPARLTLRLRSYGQALDRLVPVRSRGYPPYTPGLSTW